MRNVFLASAVLLFLSGCQSMSEATGLQWKIPDGAELRYQMVNTEVPVYQPLMVNGFEVLADSAKREQVKESLASLVLPEAGYVARIEDQGSSVRVTVRGVEPEYTGPPKTPEEEFERQIADSKAGRLMLLGDFDSDGRLLSFFFDEQQRSVLNLLFGLPQGRVSVGDSWALEVKGIELMPGFIPHHARRESKGFLESLERDSEGRLVAELFYIVAEEVDVEFIEQRPDDTVRKIPVSAEHTYVALGHFLVDEGRWLRFTAVSGRTVTGTSHDEITRIYALRPAAE